MTRLPLIAVLAGLTAVSACNRDPAPLQGERLDPRAIVSPDGPAVVGPAVATTTALSLPPVRGNADWPQRAGSATHAAGNQAIGAGTQQIWAASIGKPSDRRHRITAEPVVAGGLIFTLDSQAQVVATTTSGGRAWATDLRPGGETAGSVSGGGVAYDGGKVFATSGYGELVALDPRTGGVLWRQRVEAPISGAPTAANGVVYVTARNSSGWAVRASDGKVLWKVFGNDGVAGVMGVSSPAVFGDTVVFPFTTGELVAADVNSGEQRWIGQVAGTRLGRSIGLIRDMTGDPVIAGNTVYAGTSSGRVAAFDLQTGAMKWDAPEGAASPVLPVGNSVFLINDQAQILRLDAANGGRVWAEKLPYFTRNIVRKQNEVHNHFGPVLAGNKLYVPSSDGHLRVFDPSSGALIGQANIPGGAAAAPAIAGQTLYVVSHDGRLIAYR